VVNPAVVADEDIPAEVAYPATVENPAVLANAMEFVMVVPLPRAE